MGEAARNRPPAGSASGRRAAAEPQTAAGRPAGDDGPAGGKLVGAVVGAIKILRYLSEARAPVGVSHIAKETRLNTSTTFNILRTLTLHDLVAFDAQAKTYTLSLGIMEIARGATAFGGDLGLVRPMMDRVAREHGVTVTLWQPVSADRKVLIMTAQGRTNIRIQMAIGQRLPLLIGATGRLFAAFGRLDAAELRRQFDAIRWNRPLSFEAFLDQVAAARENGWAIDDGNFAAGTVLLSVPVLDADGTASLALTANLFAGQYEPARAGPIIADLKALAAQAAQLGPF